MIFMMNKIMLIMKILKILSQALILSNLVNPV